MRILVVEDDAPLAEFLRQRLQQEQFAFHVVSDGAEAEQLASDPAYDLVLLDLNLPLKDGREVLAQVPEREHRERANSTSAAAALDTQNAS